MSQTEETHRFQAEVDEVLALVIGSLYSHKEIFLRELLSNASDALDKLRFLAVADASLQGETPLRVRLIPDAKERTLEIADTGVGMSKDELVRLLGTVAHSGTKAFVEAAKQAGKADVSLIGQFGVGFYSAYLVADRVRVVSRAAGSDEAWEWSSAGKGEFTVRPAERATHGTSVFLHLREGEERYADPFELRSLVRTYSDFVPHPIELAGEGGAWEAANRASALWQRPPKDVTAKEYEELYRHTTRDFEPPLAWTHFRVEGSFVFSGIVYIPRRVPFDMFARESRKAGLRLYVKRVFILEDCEELVAPWLRFVRGVVDSDDLPLNVSRELLQDSSAVRSIKKQVTKKVLDRLTELSAEAPDDYATFWATFGPIVKEGLVVDPDARERIARIARFQSTHESGAATLPEYVARMKEGQTEIVYVLGEDLAQLKRAPHLESLAKRGIEVLLLTDPVDELAVDALGAFDGKKLVSAMRGDLDTATEEEKAKAELGKTEAKDFLEKAKGILGDRVTDVRPSARLATSPCCLVVPDGGHHAQLEEMLRAAGRSVPERKRILELNLEHPIVAALTRRFAADPADGRVPMAVETLLDQAVLAEGGRPVDPAGLAARMTELLALALG